jgi:hypothetical protein
MIEVRLRHEEQADAVHLMDWDPNQLNDAIRMVRSWDVRFYADDGSELTQYTDLTGAIVSEGNAAYFEILASA